jgi:hypothetical protein
MTFRTQPQPGLVDCVAGWGREIATGGWQQLASLTLTLIWMAGSSHPWVPTISSSSPLGSYHLSLVSYNDMHRNQGGLPSAARASPSSCTASRNSCTASADANGLGEEGGRAY